jgi:hypothetical protein
MAPDPGTRDPGDTPSAEPTQNEGSGAPRQPGANGTQGRRRQGARHSQQRGQTPRASNFKGRCDDLKGHVYDYANNRQAANQFTKTTREICEYVGRTYKYGADTKIALETLSEPTFAKPTDPAANATRTDVLLWEMQVDEYVKRKTMLRENLKTAYSLIYGQCSDALRAKLESRPNHAADSIGLLENIRTVMFQFQSERYSPLALHEAKRRFYSFSQDQHMTCQRYYETFKNNVEVIEHCGGSVSEDTGLVDAELIAAGLTRARATRGQLRDAEHAAKERVLACAFLRGSDRIRYGKLLEDLENDFTMGTSTTWEFLDQIGIHIRMEPTTWTRPQRVGDRFIMDDVATLSGIKPIDLVYVQRVRLFLGVMTLVDISSSDGKTLCDWALSVDENPRKPVFRFP